MFVKSGGRSRHDRARCSPDCRTRAAPVPVTYAINFVTTGGPAPTAGSFTYDPATGFSNFNVSWNSKVFDVISPADSPSIGALGTGCSSGGPNAAYGFIVLCPRQRAVAPQCMCGTPVPAISFTLTNPILNSTWLSRPPPPMASQLRR